MIGQSSIETRTPNFETRRVKLSWNSLRLEEDVHQIRKKREVMNECPEK
jgi:hypothetical protein